MAARGYQHGKRRRRGPPVARWSAGLMAGAVVLLLAALPFSARWYDVQDLSGAVRHPPSWSPVGGGDVLRKELSRAEVGEWLTWVGRGAARVSAWMGYDGLGRSLLFRCLLGWLVSLGIGLSAATVAVVVGTVWGAVAGLSGGRTDLVMMRVVDVLYGLPYVLLVILLKVGMEGLLRQGWGWGAGTANLVVLFVAIGAVGWLTPARVVRGQVLSLVQRPFVEAARASGAGTWRVLWRHLLPNLLGPILVCATLVLPQAVLQESFLSFLGIGVAAPLPSLGCLAAEGIQAVNPFVSFWWLLVFPCGLLAFTLVALNFVGDGLRDVFDPTTSAMPVG